MLPTGPKGRVSVTNGIAAAGTSATKHPEAVRQVLAWMGSREGNAYLGREGAAFVRGGDDLAVNLDGAVDVADRFLGVDAFLQKLGRGLAESRAAGNNELQGQQCGVDQSHDLKLQTRYYRIVTSKSFVDPGGGSRAAACPRAAATLHILRNLDAQDAGHPLQLAAEEVGHPEQENALLGVLLIEDGVAVPFCDR